MYAKFSFGFRAPRKQKSGFAPDRGFLIRLQARWLKAEPPFVGGLKTKFHAIGQFL